MSRSYLFVPADSERKLASAAGAGADALILDLEDAVADSRKDVARRLAVEFLRSERDIRTWVRINPLDSGAAQDDLSAVVPLAPHGIVLPKADSARVADRLAALLDALEAQAGVPRGSLRILPIATETPAAVFQLQSYLVANARIAGLTWGAEDLSAAVGASASRDGDGGWLPPYQLVRSLCLFAAAAASLPAIDTVFTDYRDMAGLAAFAAGARRDGFEGMLAIHPGQVAIINDAFAPTSDEVARARRIVASFAEQPGVGTIGIDGEMIDRPHLAQAERILQRAAAGSGSQPDDSNDDNGA